MSTLKPNISAKMSDKNLLYEFYKRTNFILLDSIYFLYLTFFISQKLTLKSEFSTLKNISFKIKNAIKISKKIIIKILTLKNKKKVNYHWILEGRMLIQYKRLNKRPNDASWL